MNKKTLTILLFIIIGAGIALSLFFIFGRGANKTGERNGGFLSSFFPAGGNNPIKPRPISTTTPSGDNLTPRQQRAKAEVLQLTKEAISGAAFINGKIRYIEKSTGHLYEIGPNGEEKIRLSNTTIPGIFEVVWSKDASSSVFRILDETGDKASAFSAFFNGSSTQGTFIARNITSIASSPEGSKIFYLFPSGSQSIGIQANFKNKNKKEIMDTPFGEFTASWPEKNTLAFLTKPSGNAEGFLYKLNLKNGSFQKLLGGIKGLTAKISPNGKKIIYSESSGANLSTNIWDISQSKKTDLNIGTFADKCVFSDISEDMLYCATPSFIPSKAVLPDDWEQGNISFSDRIWQINIKTGERNLLMEGVNNLDAVNLSLSLDENYLIFTNKKDNTLWRLKLTTSD